MELEAHVFAHDLFEDAQPPGVIRLANKRAWVPAEVLRDDQRLAGHHDQIAFHVKRFLERTPENGSSAGVRAIFRVDIPRDPVGIAASRQALVVGPPLRDADAAAPASRDGPRVHARP